MGEDFHIIAADYPGFGQSDIPSRADFTYTFDHLAQIMEKFLAAKNITRFFMYVFDYGAPIGFRIAVRHPDWILGIISQNGNVYAEGLGKKWEARTEYWKHPTAELREQYKSAFSAVDELHNLVRRCYCGKRESVIVSFISLDKDGFEWKSMWTI